MSVAVLGEALIDLIEDQHGSYRPNLGGSPYNFAISMARQGMAVRYLSPFSEDAFGERLRASLVSEGVATPLARRSRLPTSLALVWLDEDGVPAYRLYRQGVADKDVEFEEIAAHLPADLKLFHTGSLAITPSQLPRVRALLERMNREGVAVSIDLNIRLGASVDTRAYIAGVRSLLPFADIDKASIEDLQALELSQETAASVSIARGEMKSGLLVLTKGEDGAALHFDDGSIEQNTVHADPLIDTVGAGDTFHSAFLARLLRTHRLSLPAQDIARDALTEALRYASAAAAINLARSGCSPPHQLEVDAWLHSAVDEMS